MRNKKGFTLIELLAVILILGIIALIAIPTVNTIIKESRRGASESTGNQMISAAEQYKQMCDIRDGKDTDGNVCDTVFDDGFIYGSKGTTTEQYDEAKIKLLLGLKGDLPDAVTKFGVTDNGDGYIVFESNSETCTNVSNYKKDDSIEIGNYTFNAKGVVCETLSE